MAYFVVRNMQDDINRFTQENYLTRNHSTTTIVSGSMNHQVFNHNCVGQIVRSELHSNSTWPPRGNR